MGSGLGAKSGSLLPLYSRELACVLTSQTNLNYAMGSGLGAKSGSKLPHSKAPATLSFRLGLESDAAPQLGALVHLAARDHVFYRADVVDVVERVRIQNDH